MKVKLAWNRQTRVFVVWREISKLFFPPLWRDHYHRVIYPYRFPREAEEEMNRGVLQLQCSPLMAGGNPNWPLDINEMRPLAAPQSSPFMATANSYIFSSQPYYSTTSSLPLQPAWNDNQEFPESLSQLMIM